MSWKDLIKLDDSIYYIASTWTYIEYPNNTYIDGQNNIIDIKSDYTNIIVKPELVINPLNDDGSLNIGGYISIICHDTYGNDEFKRYLEDRLIFEGWKKYYKNNKIYYKLHDLIYEFKTKDDPNVIFSNSNNKIISSIKYLNKTISTQIEYELLSGESINQYNRYYEKVDNNIYKLYYYPICSDDFKVHTIHKITGETNCDCLYKFEINKNLKLDDKLDFEFKDDISSIKYYFLKQLDEKHYPLYISDKFKKEIYWNIIG